MLEDHIVRRGNQTKNQNEETRPMKGRRNAKTLLLLLKTQESNPKTKKKHSHKQMRTNSPSMHAPMPTVPLPQRVREPLGERLDGGFGGVVG